MPEPIGDPIARYYDANTSRFLRFGGGGSVAAIHRPVWGPGVRNRQEAFLFLNKVVAESIRPALAGLADPVVLDLGCGVGGTATWLAQHLGVRVIGITNSTVQAELANRRAASIGLGERCRFLTGDFQDLPALEPVAAALAIESFVHASNPAQFFQQAMRLVVPGGRLVVCDDFLAPLGHSPQRSRFWVSRFQDGWHLTNLHTVDQASAAAAQAGWQLISQESLSSYIHPWPAPVLYLVVALTSLPLPWMYWDNLRGGTALQICLKNDWTHYNTITWKQVQYHTGV